jgi:ferrous iron transport protein A
MKTTFNFTTGSECTLDALQASQSARVVEVDTRLPSGTRLLDLGFLPDTELRMIRRAPLGDPVIYELRGYQICLRKADAAQIRVKIISSEWDAPQQGELGPRP